MDDQKRAERVFVVMTQEQFQEAYEKAAEIGAAQAIKVFNDRKDEERKQYRSRKLHNTRLLLKNYHMLKEHAENSVFGRTQMEESALDILESMMSMYDNDVIIESIKRSATRTAIIMSHIDAMVSIYRIYCEKSDNRDVNLRRYHMLWDRYLSDDPMTAEELAIKYHISVPNVYKDIREATEKLTALIFGVDGLTAR